MQIRNRLWTNTNAQEENVSRVHSTQFLSMDCEWWSPKSTVKRQEWGIDFIKQNLQSGGSPACGESKQESGKRSWERKASPWGLHLDAERRSSRPQPNLSLAFKEKTKSCHEPQNGWGWRLFFPLSTLISYLEFMLIFSLSLHRPKFEERGTKS